MNHSLSFSLYLDGPRLEGFPQKISVLLLKVNKQKIGRKMTNAKAQITNAEQELTELLSPGLARLPNHLIPK